MQLIMTNSYENGVHNGLDLIEGDVVKFNHISEKDGKLKIPQIGWNKLIINNKKKAPILDFLNSNPYMYFLHSYYVKPKNENITIARAIYGKNNFCAIFQKNNLFGFQFHPERSSDQGLILLKNFTRDNL